MVNDSAIRKLAPQSAQQFDGREGLALSPSNHLLQAQELIPGIFLSVNLGLFGRRAGTGKSTTATLVFVIDRERDGWWCDVGLLPHL